MIRSRVASFPRWHYEFDLDGVITPIFDRQFINRHRQRKAYFFDPVLDLCGGTLVGKRVLDLGCNAGFWALQAARAGCDYVLGIDARAMHVEQADFVFEVHGIARDRYDFRRQDLFAIPPGSLDQFDIVLCLGLFYHVSKHMNLLELIASVNTDLLIIDTLLDPRSGSLLDVRHEPLDEPRNAFDYELVMVPTRRALCEMVRVFGYRPVVLPPHFTDYTGACDYEHGLRRALVCSKHRELDCLATEASPGTAEETDLATLPAGALLRALGRKLFRRTGLA